MRARLAIVSTEWFPSCENMVQEIKHQAFGKYPVGMRNGEVQGSLDNALYNPKYLILAFRFNEQTVARLDLPVIFYLIPLHDVFVVDPVFLSDHIK